MAKFENSVILAAVLLFGFIHCGEAVRCYVCSSDLDPYCADPFNVSLSSHTPWGGMSPHHTLQDCSSQSPPTSYLHQSRTVCKKTKQIVKDRETIIRSCSWQGYEMPVGNCPTTSVASYMKVEFCETCDMDGCNSAPGLFSASALLLAAAIASCARF